MFTDLSTVPIMTLHIYFYFLINIFILLYAIMIKSSTLPFIDVVFLGLSKKLIYSMEFINLF